MLRLRLQDRVRTHKLTFQPMGNTMTKIARSIAAVLAVVMVAGTLSACADMEARKAASDAAASAQRASDSAAAAAKAANRSAGTASHK